jgi:NADPH-dependent 2,4-dienoyl-CoA reductase/sulfur reductase-like enzyme
MEDALALREALRSARSVAIIGAGFIGTEVAAAARSFGLPVTLLDRVSTVLPRVCGAGFGAAVAQMHRARGVVLRWASLSIICWARRA